MKLPQGGIAFFDSGMGGLTVLDYCIRRLKGGLFYYYGDNARAPYGNLPPQTIRAYVGEAFAAFNRLNVQAAVLACNTATALCIDGLRKKYPFPIIGTKPAVLTAAKGGGRVWSLTTRATFESRPYKSLCAHARALNPNCKLTPFACDGLAGAIEKECLRVEAGKGLSAEDFSKYLPRGNPTAVVLGCTHYVIIKKYLESFYGCPCYDSNEGIFARLRGILSKQIPPFWDGQPPNRKRGDFQPFFTPVLRRKTLRVCLSRLKGKNTNVCLCRSLKTYGIQPLKGRVCKILFLGENSAKNARFYKRMFVFPFFTKKMDENPKFL